MTRVDSRSGSGPAPRGGDEAPARFGLVVLMAVGLLTAALYVVPQQAFASTGLVAVLLVVLGGGAGIGAAAAIVLRAASLHPTASPARSANVYFIVSGLCFVVLCITAPAAVLIGAHAWYGFSGIEPRDLLMAAVAGAGLLLGAVWAVGGAVLLRTRGMRMRLAWSKVDLAAQLFSLASVLAVVAILY